MEEAADKVCRCQEAGPRERTRVGKETCIHSVSHRMLVTLELRGCKETQLYAES